ncbi:MAG: hypothetical protein SVY10_21670 [Thermodesulfobacteriota bacterium]|nr:hypothetical protein [Thermodesulfobacteriota bacterium]
MSTLKKVIIETVKRLPDDCSIEDVIYEIHFIAQVIDGLKGTEDWKFMTTEELLNRLQHREQ